LSEVNINHTKLKCVGQNIKVVEKLSRILGKSPTISLKAPQTNVSVEMYSQNPNAECGKENANNVTRFRRVRMVDKLRQ
jgi:hypothetical protein